MPLLRVAGALVGAEAAALVGVAVFYGVELVVATPTSLGTAIAVALITLVAGVGLALSAVGLCRARRWARSPALVVQLLMVPVAWDLTGSERRALGIVLLVWAVASAGVLLSRPVTVALERGH